MSEQKKRGFSDGKYNFDKPKASQGLANEYVKMIRLHTKKNGNGKLVRSKIATKLYPKRAAIVMDESLTSEQVAEQLCCGVDDVVRLREKYLWPQPEPPAPPKSTYQQYFEDVYSSYDEEPIHKYGTTTYFEMGPNRVMIQKQVAAMPILDYGKM